MRVGGVSVLTYTFFFCVCLSVCLDIFFYLRVCSSVVWNLLVIIFTNNVLCVYIYISMYVCVHLCVCMIHILFNFGLDLSIFSVTLNFTKTLGDWCPHLKWLSRRIQSPTNKYLWCWFVFSQEKGCTLVPDVGNGVADTFWYTPSSSFFSDSFI